MIIDVFSADASGRRLAGDMGRVGAGYGGHDGVSINQSIIVILTVKVQHAKHSHKYAVYMGLPQCSVEHDHCFMIF